MATKTEIILEGKGQGQSSYESLKREVKQLEKEIRSLNLEGKKETDVYRQKELRLKVLGTEIKRVERETRNLTKSTHRSNASLLNTAKNLTVVAGGFVLATARIKDFVASSVQSFAKQELAVSKLKNGLDNLNDSASLDKLIKQANELQTKTFFADEEIINAGAMLTTFKLTGDQVELLIPRLLDMATSLEQTGQGQADLQQLAIQLGKAAGTELTAGLRRYGVIMSDTQERQLKLATGMEKTILLSQILDDNYKGLAITAGDTTAGKIKQLENAFDDLKESIGEGFILTLTGVSDSIRTTGDDAENLASSFSALEVAGKLVGGAFAVILQFSPIGLFTNLINSVQDLITNFKGAKDEISSLFDFLRQDPPNNFFGGILNAVNALTFDALPNLLEMLGLVNSASNTISKVQTFEARDNTFDVTGMFGKVGETFGNLSLVNKLMEADEKTFDKYAKKKQKTSGRTTSAIKKEINAVDELLKRITTEIDNLELKDDLTSTLLTKYAEEIKANMHIAKTMEEENRLLNARKTILKEMALYGVLGRKIGITSERPEMFGGERPLLSQLPERDKTPYPSYFQIIMDMVSDKFEEARSNIESTFSSLGDIMNILNLGTDSFVGKMLSGFNSVLTLIGSIINIISQISTGGGIFGGLLKLAGIIAAPFTGGASLAATAVAGGRAEGGSVQAGKSYWVGEKGVPELFTPNQSGYVHNIEKMYNMMSAITRPAPPVNNNNVDVHIADDGWAYVYEKGKAGYIKKMKLRT